MKNSEGILNADKVLLSTTAAIPDKMIENLASGTARKALGKAGLVGSVLTGYDIEGDYLIIPVIKEYLQLD